MTNSLRIAVIGTGFRPQATSQPPPEIEAIVGRGFHAELVEIPDGVFPGDPEARAVCDRQHYEAGLKAQNDGFDAIYINTVGDYGLTTLRETLCIPVVGSGETSLRVAASFGPFAIITIWPPALAFLYERVLEESDTRRDLLGITHLAADEDLATLVDEQNFVTDMRACELSAVDAISRARDDAITRQRAAAVVLGCTCMAPVAHAVATPASVPLLEPMTLGYRFTEFCLSSGEMPQHVRPELLRQLA
ncbi:MAG: aspartate/glutamate racemase family protein [Pseudomonadota bacterium]